MIITINHKDYNCRLDARRSCELEEKMGTNPLTALAGGVPKLSDLIMIFGKAASISEEESYNAYDEFISEGHSLPDFVAKIMAIFKDSGYFNNGDTEIKNG